MPIRRNVMALVIAVIFLFAPLRVATQSKERSPRQDGFWWQEMERPIKMGFIYGYVTAMGQMRLVLEVQKEFFENAPERTAAELKVIADPAIWSTFQKHNNVLYRLADFHSIAVGQYLAGLDQFYADYRNQRILFESAIEFVRDQIRGTPQGELDNKLEYMRRTIGGAERPR